MIPQHLALLFFAICILNGLLSFWHYHFFGVQNDYDLYWWLVCNLTYSLGFAFFALAVCKVFLGGRQVREGSRCRRADSDISMSDYRRDGCVSVARRHRSNCKVLPWLRQLCM